MSTDDHDHTVRVPPPRLCKQELDYWMERLTEIPDLRIAKVMRVRRALITDSYDEQAVLNRVVDCVYNIMGILCSRNLNH